ncbi:sigma-70 family RNA polymerase sigma factor [Cohnella candidum]|uniref:Sigma-70 family RNA polymerase sigma factor n=1 Tax=Cohnella candidum TaxID=2674991 RepID=A0A3G3JVV5_9BACL|nr:sigma-70 family RNA polymerase sigma factor [Cohnella candidum]AYQ72380.1 sigma-70 family RNA polymerase sigma factor [Cohnella candidum]
MNHSAIDRFQDIFRRHYPEVLRKIDLLVRDRAASEDLAQEVFLRLYRTPPDDIDKVGPWLQRVLTRIVWDYYRKNKRLEALADKQKNQLMTQERAYPPNEEAVILNWEKEAVRKALDQLSDRDRQVLLLREQGYSGQEIAELLHVNPNIVSTMISRAAHRLKQTMTAEGAFDS